ncbi:MAG: hypothetical protein WCB36_11665, partial [Burkholderiales bacterium]
VVAVVAVVAAVVAAVAVAAAGNGSSGGRDWISGDGFAAVIGRRFDQLCIISSGGYAGRCCHRKSV